MKLVVYLAGEIHSDWRGELKNEAEAIGLQVEFVGPQTNHQKSDDIGEDIMGKQPGKLYRDDAASDINNLRTQVLMQKADIVIAKFGEEYKQWNTAMDASAATTINKPLIIIRPKSLIHPLKELSNKANVTVESNEQVLKVLAYIFA